MRHNMFQFYFGLADTMTMVYAQLIYMYAGTDCTPVVVKKVLDYLPTYERDT